MRLRKYLRFITNFLMVIIAASFATASFVASWRLGQTTIPDPLVGSMLGGLGVALAALKIILPFVITEQWRNNFRASILLSASLWVIIFCWCWLGTCLVLFNLLATSPAPFSASSGFISLEDIDVQILMAVIMAFYIELLSGTLPLLMTQGFSRSSPAAHASCQPHADTGSALQANIVQLPLRHDIIREIQRFLNHRTELNEHVSVGASELYLAFKFYCHESNISPCSQKLFGETMSSLKFERARLGKSGRYHYRRIQLRHGAFDVAA